MIEVVYTKGVELPQHQIWLDPAKVQPFAFVSHAHSDHIGNHREVFFSPETALLMRKRLAGKRQEWVFPYGELHELPQRPGVRISLLRSGHILGAAQLYLESEHGSLLYTGDFKLRQGLSTEGVEWRHAETLIMETTFGKPEYRMPPSEEVFAEIVRFCQCSLEEGALPVLLSYSLGKSQELVCGLLRAGLTPLLQKAVWEMTEIYRELRPGFPMGYLPFDGTAVEGGVLICPPNVARKGFIRRIPQVRTAVVTGWAIDPRARYRYQTDAAFPLSDHADYDDLLRYVEVVQPKRVLTLHGFASAFANDLRSRGVEAYAISEADQLELLF